MNQYDDTSENFGNVDPLEYEKRKTKAKDATAATKFQTLMVRRGQGWDWLSITAPDGRKAVLFITRVVDDHAEVGVASEDLENGAKLPAVRTISGDFDRAVTAHEPAARCKLHLKKHDQGWDGLGVTFPDSAGTDEADLDAEIYFSHVWFRKVALTVRAPRSVKLRKIEAKG